MPLPEFFDLGLIVQLESKLNLSRIVWSIAGRPDFPEGGTGEIARVSDRYHAVTAEARRIEVRMVQDVEELGPELQREALAELHGLEE